MRNVRELTKQEYDEYVTKAMLLGLHYDWRFHTFYPINAAVQHDEIELDADTLEELDGEARFARMVEGSLYCGATWDGLQRFTADEERGINYVPIPDPRR